RRPVILLSRAEHEIPAIHGRRRPRTVKLDVVDLGALCASDAGGGECLPNLPGEMDKLVKVGAFDGEGMISDQKKPVAAPGNVTDHCTESGDFDVDGSGPAVARYV